MKTLRIVLVTAIALLMTTPLMAQEKGKKGSRPQLSPVSRVILRMKKLHDAIEEVDLADEQEESLKALHEEFGPGMKEAFGKLQGVLTDEQENTAKEAAKEAKEAGKENWAFFSAVEASITLTDEQTEKINEVGEELTTLQQQAMRKVMRVLTEEQREEVRASMAPKTRKDREKKVSE